MIVSFNWLKKFVNIELSASELAAEIGSKLVEVETVIDLCAKYQGVVVADVKLVEPVEGSDHLSRVLLDDGGVNSEVERDENGLVQVVCGAPNVQADTQIAWIMPGAIVPETFSTDQPFKLDSRPLMGVMSNGMVASPRELDLYDEHDGILILDQTFAAGTPFAEAYELDDYLFDIENKSLTQRPDCFGVIGFAREVATILGQEFKSPDWLISDDLFAVGQDDQFKLAITNPILSDKYQVAKVDVPADFSGLNILEKSYLARVGVKLVSPIVDTVNMAMMASAQPLHSFDYDKVKAICDQQGLDKIKLTVRYAKAGEKLAIIGGKTLTLDAQDIVISAGETAIALAGAIGGAETEVDVNTKSIILEAATFNLYKLRATQMRHGLSSDALTRFTKGQPAHLSRVVLAQAIDALMNQKQASNQLKIASVGDGQAHIKIELEADFVNRILGSDFSMEEIRQILTRAEFKVELDDDKLQVQVPFWRNDVHKPIELVEEIGRITGYDNLPTVLPSRTISAVELEPFDKFKFMLADALTSAGANEVLTYSFVNEDLLKKAGQDVDNSYKIVNSISPDLERYRQNLLPSLVNLVHSNIKAGFDKFVLYEMNKTHQKSDGLNEEKIPFENQNLALVFVDKNSDQTAYYGAKRYLEVLAQKLNLEFNYQPISNNCPENSLFEPKRAAVVKVGEWVIGYVGEFKSSVIKNFKLPLASAGCEINLQQLFEANFTTPMIDIESESKFPSVNRDICFEVVAGLEFGKLEQALIQAGEDLAQQVKFKSLDIFAKDETKKRLTFRLIITDFDKTLTSDQVDKIVEIILTQVKTEVGFEVI